MYSQNLGWKLVDVVWSSTSLLRQHRSCSQCNPMAPRTFRNHFTQPFPPVTSHIVFSSTDSNNRIHNRTFAGPRRRSRSTSCPRVRGSEGVGGSRAAAGSSSNNGEVKARKESSRGRLRKRPSLLTAFQNNYIIIIWFFKHFSIWQPQGWIKSMNPRERGVTISHSHSTLPSQPSKLISRVGQLEQANQYSECSQ